MPHQTWRAALILSGRQILVDHAIRVDARGHIEAIVPAAQAPHATDLGDVALVPGLINAHSHAFQRAIRGRTEYLHAQRPHEDFWSWRQLMYRVAQRLQPEALGAISRMAFLEMALSGVTSVGEFHYLHHQPDGTPYVEPNELANRVILAARSVGIRIALLRVAYARGGYQQAASPEQARFIDAHPDAIINAVTTLAGTWADTPTVTVGLAPHSVRAVPGPWLTRLAAHAQVTGAVLHIHACEQKAELAQCRAEYGAEPIQVLHDHGALTASTTLVHATHLNDRALELCAQARPTVCACPTTERNLGDGFLPASALLARRVPIALGSDSHAEIDLWQELRLVESHERLRAERRNVLAQHHSQWLPAPADHQLQTADLLWPMATAHGARSLGLNTGTLTPGRPADFIALDLTDASLAGLDPASLIPHLCFATTPRAVRHSFVAGRPVIESGRHPDQAEIVATFRRVMTELF
jgi:formimidoylglutamate deiminase